MFDENDNKKDDRGQKKPQGGFSMPPFTWVAWIVILGALVALMLLKGHLAPQSGTQLSEADFIEKFNSNQIVQATVTYPSVSGGAGSVTGKFYDLGKDGKPDQTKVESFIV